LRRGGPGQARPGRPRRDQDCHQCCPRHESHGRWARCRDGAIFEAAAACGGRLSGPARGGRGGSRAGAGHRGHGDGTRQDADGARRVCPGRADRVHARHRRGGSPPRSRRRLKRRWSRSASSAGFAAMVTWTDDCDAKPDPDTVTWPPGLTFALEIVRAPLDWYWARTACDPSTTSSSAATRPGNASSTYPLSEQRSL
jgi:hypothetical protein